MANRKNKNRISKFMQGVKPGLFQAESAGEAPMISITDTPYEVDLTQSKWEELEKEILENAQIIIDSKAELLDQVEEESAIYNQDKVFVKQIFEGSYTEHIPISSIMVDALTSRCNRQIFSLNPLFRCKAQEETDDYNRIETIEEHMEHQNKVQSDTMSNLDKAMYQVGKHGVAILVPRWQYERRASHTVEHYDTVDQFLEAFGEEKRDIAADVLEELAKPDSQGVDLQIKTIDTVKNFPEIELCHLEDFYVLDTVDDLKNAKFMFRGLNLTWHQLSGYVSKHFTDEDLEEFKKVYSTEDVKNESERNASKEGAPLENVDYKLRPYRIFEGIYIADMDGDDIEETYLVTFSMEHKKMMRFHFYPYGHSRPYFVPIVAIPKEKSWRGYSVIEKVKKIQRVIDILWNQIFNINDTSAYPLILARKTGSYDPEDHVIKPYGIWWLNDPEGDVKFEQMPQVPLQSLTLLQESLRFAELVSGIPFISLGLPSPRDEEAPATKALLLRNEANIRIVDMINRIKMGLSEAGRQCYALNSQFLPIEDQFRVTNPKAGKPPFMKISRKDYMLRVDVVVEGVSEYNSWESEMMAMERELVRLTTPPLDNLTLGRYPEGVINLLRDITRRSGFVNVDRYVPSEDFMKKLRMEDAMIAAAQLQIQEAQQQQEQAQVGEEVENLKDQGVMEFIAGRMGRKHLEDHFSGQMEQVKKKAIQDHMATQGETNGSSINK